MFLSYFFRGPAEKEMLWTKKFGLNLIVILYHKNTIGVPNLSIAIAITVDNDK